MLIFMAAKLQIRLSGSGAAATAYTEGFTLMSTNLFLNDVPLWLNAQLGVKR